MSRAMDMYVSGDSVSLQEMLDIDIKSEIDILVGGQNDFSGFNFADLPPLELDDASDIRWFSSNSNLSNSSFSLDLSNDDTTTMVNPNTVMPFGSRISLAQSIRSPSPTLKESHLTFSPSTIKVGNVKSEGLSVKKDLLNKLSDLESKKSSVKISKVTSIIAKPVDKTMHNKSNATIISFKNAVQQQLITPVNVTPIRTINTNHSRKQQINHGLLLDTERAYPKPAYSYSCLIAMALKNSRTGSLPVSEIYNFMCRHFPYFKTAPNGWKNSVRHNLSLNKCFEKIEKPAINGAQRKGCLWAMNPAKINKMDDEVQKWSRKDPSAIRKAMVHPDHLERLERGELKFTYDDADNFGSAESEEVSEESEAEPEQERTARPVKEEPRFFNISTIKNEVDEDYIEVTDTMICDQMDVEEDEDKLIVEMALAQKELLEYDRCASNKKRRIFLVQE